MIFYWYGISLTGIGFRMVKVVVLGIVALVFDQGVAVVLGGSGYGVWSKFDYGFRERRYSSSLAVHGKEDGAVIAWVEDDSVMVWVWEVLSEEDGSRWLGG
ncbi:unnamed protein product [Dovyalis caffra]|uniref:Transmembrane protein n=1 Tax=Dovyalis caffra TaxID=77055 RepID=A0AAV1R894_9ROSI|nr:unnamed protein product [Dovyalis caffra]